MSSLRDPSKRHDAFFRKARDEGYVARSVYKLEEIDRKLHLLKAGQRVLDLGCRPGSWMQYAVKKAGPKGAVVGIDRMELPVPIRGTRVVIGDLMTTTDAELLGDLKAFDLVMSDMAPDTTGIRATDQARSANLFEEALARAERMLAPGGGFLGKIFQGPDVEVLRKRMRGRFAEVKLIKPDGSRTESTEVYLAGTGFKP